MTVDAAAAPAVSTRRVWVNRAVFIVPAVLYLIAVLLGVTTSSIGIGMLREQPSDPQGVQIGASQAVRSDEYGTESPIWLGEMASEGDGPLNPLTTSNDFFAQIPSGPLSGVVFFDGTLLRLGDTIPQQMLFAAKWWLPTLLLFIGLPVWFRQITGKLRWGYLAAVLVFFAPASMWWSGRPVNTLGFVAAGCALAVFAARRFEERRWTTAIIAVIGAGVLLARLPTYYQPLAIVVGIPPIVATGAYLLLRSAPWRTRLVGLAAVIVSTLFWTAGIFWESRDAVVAGLSTVYPGDRHSTGTAMEVGRLLGGTDLAWLESVARTGHLFESELATSFNVLFAVMALMFVARRWRGSRDVTLVFIPLAAFGVFWLCWSMVDAGSLGAALPIVNRVPNFRAVQGAGFIATLAFCFFLSAWTPPRRLAVPLTTGAIAALLSAYGGSALQVTLLPDLHTWMIWVSALVTGLVVFLLLWRPRSWAPPAIAGVAVIAMTATAVPVLFGLGDLRESDTARQFERWGDQSEAAGTVWASDSGSVDALMTATGTPALSSRQQIGPDEQNWRRLDPGAAHEGMWNRGGLHIEFSWSGDPDLDWSMPSPDVVVISGSPCTVAERLPELTRIVSSQDLDLTCLAPVQTIDWSGSRYTVYDVQP